MLLNSRFWNITVFGLAIISIILIIYEFLTPVVYGDISKIIIIDLGICVIFAIDFFYRLINSNDRGKYLKFHGFEILAFIPSLIFNLIDSEILIAVGFRSVRMMRVLVVSARLLRFKSVSAYFVAGSKLIYLSIFFLLPSCSLIEMPTGFGGFMKTIRKLQKQVKKAEKICNKECRTNEKLSDEWCNCMDICFDMDGGASYCPTDSTKNNQSKKESNQQNVTILKR